MGVHVEKLKIICYPDPCLRKACEEITEFDDELAAVAFKMLDLMHTGNGVGLAGPQVGLLWRLFVCNPTPDVPENDLVVINPVLEDLEGAVVGEEGCLSIPHVTVNVRRAQKCTLKAVDVRGRPYTLSQENLPARIWQHETDHLNGRLILDFQNPADELANRRQLKELEEQYKRAKRRRHVRKPVS
jgi:peptide deformylase